MAADRKAVQLRIVAKDGLMVAGQPDIKFKAIRTLVQRKIEGRQRIFGSVAAGAAVS
jgi:hypothetical protein